LNSNPILDANLACISKYNPELKYKIIRINSLKNDISFVNTVLQEPNLMYNGVYIHNNYGAELEAREIFSKAENSPHEIHVIYGFGLGYLFKEFALKSEGTVLLYEPDIEILAAVLEVVDFTNELSKNNVFVFNDFNVLKKFYIDKHKCKTKTSVTFLPTYKKIFEKNFEDFLNKLNLAMGAIVINDNYMQKKMVPAIKMLYRNINLLVNEIPLNEYKNIYENQTAIIVSAGPSLDRDVEIIKKYRENVIIFSVGQALRTLITHGIKPDFVSLIETNNQMSQIEGLDTSNIDLIVEPITYNELHQSNFQSIISYPSHTSIANLIWTNIADIDATPYFSSGTVSYTILYAAKILGFKNIILSGQDLAFIDGKCYAKEARNTGLKFEYDEKTNDVKVYVDDFKTFAESFFDKKSTYTEEQKLYHAQRRLESIKSNIHFVKGINNEMLPTTKDYASFIQEFEDFAIQNKENINLYNTSLNGAKIKGFEDISLEEILKQQPIAVKKELKSTFSYNVPEIINNLNNEKNIINEILKLLSTAKILIMNYDKEYQHRKLVNESCMKYFKQILVIYIDLSDTYCKKSRTFLYLHKARSYELNGSLQEKNNSNPNAVHKVYEQMKTYITTITDDLKEITETLKIKVQNLDEMLNTKS